MFGNTINTWKSDPIWIRFIFILTHCHLIIVKQAFSFFHSTMHTHVLISFYLCIQKTANIEIKEEF